jgi:hypothetical protein
MLVLKQISDELFNISTILSVTIPPTISNTILQSLQYIHDLLTKTLKKNEKISTNFVKFQKFQKFQKFLHKNHSQLHSSATRVQVDSIITILPQNSIFLIFSPLINLLVAPIALCDVPIKRIILQLLSTWVTTGVFTSLTQLYTQQLQYIKFLEVLDEIEGCFGDEKSEEEGVETNDEEIHQISTPLSRLIAITSTTTPIDQITRDLCEYTQRDKNCEHSELLFEQFLNKFFKNEIQDNKHNKNNKNKKILNLFNKNIKFNFEQNLIQIQTFILTYILQSTLFIHNTYSNPNSLSKLYTFKPESDIYNNILQFEQFNSNILFSQNLKNQPNIPQNSKHSQPQFLQNIFSPSPLITRLPPLLPQQSPPPCTPQPPPKKPKNKSRPLPQALNLSLSTIHPS